jgi:predicted naringenin-chalcone synthase
MLPGQLKELDSTEERNNAYNKFAPKLAAQAARKALTKWGGDIDHITHVMSISCTGTCGMVYSVTTLTLQ